MSWCWEGGREGGEGSLLIGSAYHKNINAKA